MFAQTVWLIPCYPLLGVLLSFFWSPALVRRTGPRPVGYLNLFTTVVALLHSALAFKAFWHQPPQFLEFSWLQVADLQLSLPLEISAVTLGASLVITLLNLLVQIYALGYLEADWGWARLYSLLGLFEAGMTALVLCDSLFFSYILLEILTLGTYLIVGYWFNQSLVVSGARDAFLTKRVGDLILLMGVLALYPLAGTWNFSELAVWAETAQVRPLTIALIGIALVSGPVSKCAQFPLHLWLDEAMEGPLPSTILRNSLVVATGAWVLVKLEPVIALSPWASGMAIAVGSISALGGSLIAAAQIDAKRVLSYLASAYMGLIFIAIGSGYTDSALSLVLTHAFATALLIMSVGSIILNTVTQDLTQLGGLWSRRPVTGLSFVFGAAGLLALPPLGGFWALSDLLNHLWQDQQWLSLGIVVATNAVIGFALVRMFGLMFAGDRTPMTARAAEPFWLVVLPMTMMAGLTLHLPLAMNRLGLLTEQLPQGSQFSASLAWILLWSSVLGIAIATFFYIFPRRLSQNQTQDEQADAPIGSAVVQGARQVLARDFYTEEVYAMTAIALVDRLSRFTDWLDRYVIDGLVNLVGLTSLFSGEALKYGNDGRSQFYALTITFFVALIGLYMGWSYLMDWLPTQLTANALSLLP